MTTEGGREAFARLYKGPGRLEIDIKISLVRKVNNKEGSISGLAKENNVSRKTIYKWLDQYKKDGNLNEKYASGLIHPKAYSWEEISKILSQVVKNPELSIHNLAKKLSLSSHGVFNTLSRINLTYKDARYAYAASHPEEKRIPVYSWLSQRLKIVWEQFVPNLLTAPPTESFAKRAFLFSKTFLTSTTLSSLFTYAFIYWIRILGSSSTGHPVGLFFASVALLAGSFFFIYSLKYYITIAIVLSFSQGGESRGEGNQIKRKGFFAWLLGEGGLGKKGNAVALRSNLDSVTLQNKPYISVHIPFYNEKNVVRRSIEAAISFDYPSYEIILCDDSTDETTQIIRDYQKEYLSKGTNLKIEVNEKEGWELSEVEVKPGVMLRHLHRKTRSGFKGGALRLALSVSDPKTEFVTVFDADFVPYPDTLQLFLKNFKVQNKMSEDYTQSKVAAVQGYQWHVLNKSENWITRGVRSEYAGSYVVERSGTEIYGGLKQISGAVYMIRKEPLKEVGWGVSITEDFELTLKLYAHGYKVLYTPYVQAPAECVSTLKRLIRQRMRWAEGHSNNIKKMFKGLMTGDKLNLPEKLEFLYLSPYYLQALFFLVGTLSWFLAEAVFASRLPFWTELWGWSLVLTNIIALPLLNGVGLFLEESEEKDYSGLLSFIALSYIVVPFQAYASVKGFLEKEEGPWFRTPKTGRITDVFGRSKFYRFISGIIPSREPAYSEVPSSYLALETANNKWEGFRIKPKQIKWVGKLVLVILLSTSTFISSMARFVPLLPIQEAKAYDGVIEDSKTNWTKKFIYDHPEYADMPIVKRNESSIHFLKPNGQIEAQSLGIPINYQDENGVWKDIDTTIENKSDDSSYNYQNKKNNFETSFKDNTKGDNIVKFDMNGRAIQFKLEDSSELGSVDNSSSVVSGNTVTYSNVYDGVDLRYTVSSTQLLEEFIVASPVTASKINSIAEQFTFSNVAYKEQPDGSIKFLDSQTNEHVFTIPKPVMYELNNRSEQSFGLHYTITQEGDNYYITKVLDQAGKDWLADPARVYPLVIDTSTAATSPGTMADSNAVGTMAWSNPNNAKVSDNVYATVLGLTWYESIKDYAVKIVKSDGSIGTTNKASATDWSLTEAYFSYGGATDKWDETWLYSDINDVDFGVVLSAYGPNGGTSHYLKATNFGFSIPSGATINGILAEIERKEVSGREGDVSAYVDHIRITIYYTEGVIPENVIMFLGLGVVIPFWVKRRRVLE